MELFLTILLSISSYSFAADTDKLPKRLEYNCGKMYGYPVTVKITHAKPGSYMPYIAKFTSWGKDGTTGSLIRSKVYNMEGDTGLWDTKDGQVRVIHLNEVGRPQHQVILEKKVKLGEIAESARLFSTDEGDGVEFKCKVTKSSNR